MAGHTGPGKNSTRAALHNMGFKVTPASCATFIPSPALLQRGAGPSHAPQRGATLPAGLTQQTCPSTDVKDALHIREAGNYYHPFLLRGK